MRYRHEKRRRLGSLTPYHRHFSTMRPGHVEALALVPGWAANCTAVPNRSFSSATG